MATSGSYTTANVHDIKSEHIGFAAMPRRRKRPEIIDLFDYADDNGRLSIVYIAKNKVNGKCYIGVTRLGVNARRLKHEQNAKRGQKSKFYQAIRKYGPESFEWAVLEECSNYKGALRAEQRYVAEMAPAYNMTLGGEGVMGIRFSAEARQKMSAAKQGKSPWPNGQCPDHIRQKLVDAWKVRERKPPTPKQKNHTKRWINAGVAARRKPVECTVTGRRFESVSELAKLLGVTTGHITLWLRGAKPRKSSNIVFTYRYAEK